MIFFAGHGNIAGGQFYLYPEDVNPGNLAATGLSAEEIKTELAKLPGRVVPMMDACHAGAFGNMTDDLSSHLSREDTGVAVLLAVSGKETAKERLLEKEKVGHGHFAAPIIEGLAGGGDIKRGRDGSVGLHHLQVHMVDRVIELSDDSQHPTAANAAEHRVCIPHQTRKEMTHRLAATPLQPHPAAWRLNGNIRTDAP